MCGVYEILNTANNKRYVGSSINIERRFKEHRRALVGQYHENKHLQNAWNKYGSYSFVFNILEECKPDQRLIVEQEYIDYYEVADRRFGYNIDPYADHSGNTLSEETKRKISESNKGRKWTNEMRKKIIDAITGIKKPKQSQVMRKKFAEGNPTMPRYNQVSIEKQKLWSKHLSEWTSKRYSKLENIPQTAQCIKVIFSNDIKYYVSQHAAARALGVDKSAIKYCMSHTQGYCKKLQCTFVKISRDEFFKQNKIVGQK